MHGRKVLQGHKPPSIAADAQQPAHALAWLLLGMRPASAARRAVRGCAWHARGCSLPCLQHACAPACTAKQDNNHILRPAGGFEKRTGHITDVPDSQAGKTGQEGGKGREEVHLYGMSRRSRFSRFNKRSMSENI